MAALSLFDLPVPPCPPGIDLRCGDVAAMLADQRGAGARLVIADPPWLYESGGVFRGWQGGNAGCIEDHYATTTDLSIVSVVDAAFDCAADGSRLALWVTWPKLGEWMAASAGMRWRYVTGGAWGKAGQMGVGFHWRGDSEMLLVYVKGSPGRPFEAVSNLHVSKRTDHSEKPVDWLRAAVRAWTEPGDLVLSVYSGLFPEGRACALEGRRCVGAEIDPERHTAALGRLAQWRTAL